jgi:hypothetical protein
MKQKRLIVFVFILLFILSPILFRKYRVPLISNGKVVAVATRPLVFPWNDNKFYVYVGNDKAFSVWADFFDFPMFIYPFADGKRFLCDYDDDVDILVFVVDFNASATNVSNSSMWPSDDRLRAHLAQRATNVVIETQGVVRLPNYAELQEVSSYLASLTPRQFKTRSLPLGDLGLYRFYATKENLLADLDTNRDSFWPMAK